MLADVLAFPASSPCKRGFGHGGETAFSARDPVLRCPPHLPTRRRRNDRLGDRSASPRNAGRAAKARSGAPVQAEVLCLFAGMCVFLAPCCVIVGNSDQSGAPAADLRPLPRHPLRQARRRPADGTDRLAAGALRRRSALPPSRCVSASRRRRHETRSPVGLINREPGPGRRSARPLRRRRASWSRVRASPAAARRLGVEACAIRCQISEHGIVAERLIAIEPAEHP